MPTLALALLEGQSHGLDRLDAQLLLLHALGKPAIERAWLLAHDTDELPASAQAGFEAFVQRRAAGEPLAYITGHKEFFGLDLLVDERVLVPRPDTETLVEWALDVVAKRSDGTAPISVLDLGTGSGAIALALKATRPALEVSATDASADALAVARVNAQRLKLEVQFAQGSWFDTAPGRYHAIVSNPPYVAAQDPHLEALKHEPTQALTSGGDGLDDIRHIVAEAPAHLHPAGWLLLEHGYNQAVAVQDLLLGAGFVNVQSRPDLSGTLRCSGGQYPR
jgi:release factor glutamine methyltransferase